LALQGIHGNIKAPHYHLPTSFPTVPSLQTASFPRASISPSHFSFLA
jgi:hypothetical protein